MHFHEVVNQINKILDQYKANEISKKETILNSRVCLEDFYHSNNHRNKAIIKITEELLEGQKRTIDGFVESLVIQRLIKTRRYKKERAEEVLERQLLLNDLSDLVDENDNSQKNNKIKSVDKFNFDDII